MSNPRLEDMVCTECNRTLGECTCAALPPVRSEPLLARADVLADYAKWADLEKMPAAADHLRNAVAVILYEHDKRSANDGRTCDAPKETP